MSRPVRTTQNQMVWLKKKTVQIVKRIFKKCKEDSSDPNLALLESVQVL